ncbi:MAG TPA: ABC transporter ATP-binding protein [Allosphingosinicella sp.]|jgi:multiple sugar transport system ATP-binding protein|nr:ABC transporter ATP-binding protein [Allosphingosinicella sp.]
MANVSLSNVTKSFGATPVLRDINLAIDDGEFVVLVGPSGCGKSTLLRVLAGLEEVDSGEVRIGDALVNGLPPDKRGIAMVFQSYALYPHMTVRQNMGFGLRLAGHDRNAVDSAVAKAAALLDIEPLLDRRPKMLSGGQRQRVAIGRAIVREPTVFLFDEPLSNLDAELRVRMRYEFAKLHQRLRTTTVYVTHDQVEAMTLASRIAIMDRGRVEQFGTAHELYNHPASLFVASFIGSPRMNLLQATIEAAAASGVAVRLRQGTEVDAAADAAGAEKGDRVTLGIRPEHLRLGADGLAATVTLIESLGNIRFAYLASDAADDPLIMQLMPGDQIRSGDRVQLSITASEAYVFSADGRALRRFRGAQDTIAA